MSHSKVQLTVKMHDCNRFGINCQNYLTVPNLILLLSITLLLSTTLLLSIYLVPLASLVILNWYEIQNLVIITYQNQ